MWDGKGFISGKCQIEHVLKQHITCCFVKGSVATLTITVSSIMANPYAYGTWTVASPSLSIWHNKSHLLTKSADTFIIIFNNGLKYQKMADPVWKLINVYQTKFTLP